MDKDDLFVKEFKDAYEKYFGEAVTEKEAREKFSRLVNILRIIIYDESGAYEGPRAPFSNDESKLSSDLED